MDESNRDLSVKGEVQPGTTNGRVPQQRNFTPILFERSRRGYSPVVQIQEESMMSEKRKRSLLFALVLSNAATFPALSADRPAGAVFAMSNSEIRNMITMYWRSETGQLSFVGRFSTNGRGTGGTNDPLQSQYSIALTADHQYLLAANAGTSDISVLRVSQQQGLALASVTPSGGASPLSIAIWQDLVYVVNFTGSYHTAGFRLTPNGELHSIPNSKQPLSNLDPGASTLAFSPDGTKLVISERISNKIDVFTVLPDGTLTNPVYNPSVGVEPFGLQFTPNGTLLVTETNGGPPKNGSVSSYRINADNTITPISAAASASGQATCWIATNGANAWVTDTASGNIGALTVSASGTLTPAGSVALPSSSAFPLDPALSSDSKFLYVLYSGIGQIIGYQTASDGSLRPISTVSPYGPVTGEEGLAAY